MSSEPTFDMKKFIPLILAICAVLGPLMFMNSCANTTEAPSGGAKDTIPPYIIAITPLPGATNVPTKGASFVFGFDEYVTIKNPANILLSPPQQKRPVAKLRGKNLVVSFEEELKPNTTYTLSFTDAIADANEGNMFAGYSYAFSTGPKIDSMMITGTVVDCNTLAPVKGATVLLQKDFSDSAIFKTLPYAVAKTDDWGFFVMPFIQDTLYRLFAIKDADNNNLLNAETEMVGFCDSAVRPVMTASDTTREMLRYDMLDTLSCLARRSEYEIKLFKEIPTKQLIVNRERTAERSAYITFMAQNARINSITINDFRPNQIISQFNLQRDSLELWINSRRAAPDTMKISVDYYKTDSTGVMKPETEEIKLTLDDSKRTYSKRSRRDITQEDTTCNFTLTATPETIEQTGYILEFEYPIIYEHFNSMIFSYVTPRQSVDTSTFHVVRDSLNLRKYYVIPDEKLQTGYEYRLKIPQDAFRDINGFYSDSTEVKCSLPTDDKLSTMIISFTGVDRKIIIDLLDEKRNKVLRNYVIDADTTLNFPYLKEGKYCIRITEDSNRNSFVDTGSILERRQPEKVMFYEIDGDSYIDIPASSEISQTINISEMFKD